MLRLRAQLVTLSACDTGSGSVHGQEGAASLVRPFIAAGARSVVASLWAMDDTFSLALMRDFYPRRRRRGRCGNRLARRKAPDAQDVWTTGHRSTLERRPRLR